MPAGAAKSAPHPATTVSRRDAEADPLEITVVPRAHSGGMDAVTTVAAYWAAANARDWAAFGDLVCPDVVYELPQSRERITGRADYVRFNAEYPAERWVVEPVRIVGGDGHAASWIRFLAGGEEQTGVCFFDLDEAGLIARITDFWPEPFEPPPGREHLSVRY